jgi:hypothetical protein
MLDSILSAADIFSLWALVAPREPFAWIGFAAAFGLARLVSHWIQDERTPEDDDLSVW